MAKCVTCIYTHAQSYTDASVENTINIKMLERNCVAMLLKPRPTARCSSEIALQSNQGCVVLHIHTCACTLCSIFEGLFLFCSFYCSGDNNPYPTGLCAEGCYCPGGANSSCQFPNPPGSFSEQGQAANTLCFEGTFQQVS